ncbi:MAG: hypothetical protein IPK19_25055 [Chloroflexi bacterium]|nr:hypothetical protein [Chloroflexota bacterium]
MTGQLTNAAGTRTLHKVERVAIKVTPLGALDPLEWLAQNPFQGMHSSLPTPMTA